MENRSESLVQILKNANASQMLSRKSLIDHGFTNDEIEQAQSQGRVAILGKGGTFDSVILITDSEP